jgi:hypothetical protein
MGSKSFKIAFTLGLMASAALGFPACSSEDDPPSTPGGSGPGGSGGSGGSAGSGGSGGSGGSTGGTGGEPPVECGGMVCPTALNDYVPACCVGTKCGLVPPPDLGLSADCVETKQAGRPDSTCYPDAGVPIDAGGLDAGNLLDGGVFVIQGCCRPNGKCGALLNFPDYGVEFGCVDPTQYVDAGQAAPSCTP